MKKKLAISLILMTTLLFFVSYGIAIEKAPKKAGVVRDEYGVPRITAPTNEKLFELLGYTVAEDRLWQLEINKRTARGTLAEILGAKYLSADQATRLRGYTEEEYISIFHSLLPETKRMTYAYVHGINRRIDKVIGEDKLLPYEFKKLGIKPSRWAVTDTLAFTTFMMRRFGMVGGNELSNLVELDQLIGKYGENTGWSMFNDAHWANDPSAPSYIEKEMKDATPRKLHCAKEAPRYTKSFKNVEKAAKGYQQLMASALQVTTELGIPMYSPNASFAWAVARERTATGYPMLAGNPQMGFGFPCINYEVHLRGGHGFNVAGFTNPGWFHIAIGHNEDIAWTHMVGMGDNVDIYEETLNPTNREQYLYRGKWVNMEKRVETIMIAGSTPVTMTIYRTLHGPVIAPFPFDPNDSTLTNVYTWKYAHWLLDAKTSWLEINRARNPWEFEKGVKDIYTSLHSIYADRSGNIGYWQTGLVPIRPTGTDFRLPLLGTGEEEWTGKFRRTSKAVNPKKGYICGWNNKSSPKFNNADTGFFGKYHRALWLERTLNDKIEVTLEDMRNIQLMMGSVGSSLIPPLGVDGCGIFIKDLLAYLSNAIKGIPPSDPYYGKLNEALSILSSWDGRALESVLTSTNLKVAQSIFDNWVTLMIKNTFQDEFGGITSFARWTLQNFNMLLHALDGPLSPLPPSRNYIDDITTPGVIETVDEMVVRSMKQTIDKLTLEFETSNMSEWTKPRPQTDIVSEVIGVIGSFPAVVSGTYSFIAELKPKGIEGMSRWPYGSSGFIGMDNTGNPVYDNPYLFNMLDLYVNYEWQDMFIGKEYKWKDMFRGKEYK